MLSVAKKELEKRGIYVLAEEKGLCIIGTGVCEEFRVGVADSLTGKILVPPIFAWTYAGQSFKRDDGSVYHASYHRDVLPDYDYSEWVLNSFIKI